MNDSNFYSDTISNNKDQYSFTVASGRSVDGKLISSSNQENLISEVLNYVEKTVGTDARVIKFWIADSTHANSAFGWKLLNEAKKTLGPKGYNLEVSARVVPFNSLYRNSNSENTYDFIIQKRRILPHGSPN